MTPQQFQAKIQRDPLWYVSEVLGIELWEAQKRILLSVFANPKTTAKTCHGIGKSFDAATTVLTFLAAYRSAIVLTTAPTWRQVEDVIWKEIRSAHSRARVELGGTLLRTRYTLAPDWFAVGLSTDDPNKFQGYHSPHMLIIVDESSGVEAKLFDAIEGIGSTAHVRILELGNPTDPTGHFYQTFTSEFYHKITVSCFDTPNFNALPTLQALKASTFEERASAVTHPHLITPQWVFERLQEWGESSPMFQARCLGEFPVEGDDTLFPIALFEKCIRCTNEGDINQQALGVDIARFGSDKTVFAPKVGNRIKEIQRYSKESTMQTTGRIMQWHAVYPYAVVKTDDVGVGGGVTDRLNELNQNRTLQLQPINVGLPSQYPDQFFNLRAQYYWYLRQKAESGELILPDDDKLRSDLCSMKYTITSRGQIKIESKEEMKKRGLPSPDSADAVMLASAPVTTNSFLEFYKSA